MELWPEPSPFAVLVLSVHLIKREGGSKCRLRQLGKVPQTPQRRFATSFKEGRLDAMNRCLEVACPEGSNDVIEGVHYELGQSVSSDPDSASHFREATAQLHSN
jgi:hypothetical protein